MRRNYLSWSVLVIGIIGTAYGGYTLFYHYSRGEGLFRPGLIFLIFGLVFLIPSLALNIYFSLRNRRPTSVPYKQEKPKEKEAEESPTPVEEPKEEPTPIEEPKEEVGQVPQEEPAPYVSRLAAREEAPSRVYSSTSFVRKMGYGTVLRISGPRIVDMRSSTYYRIEGNIVYEDGGGPRYEIRGNQIRDVFGSSLYELSGNNINKVFGGFHASISGNQITLFDLSEKYEMSESLSRNQLLAVAAILFGRY